MYRKERNKNKFQFGSLQKGKAETKTVMQRKKMVIFIWSNGSQQNFSR